MSTQKTQKLPKLDFLRALSALAVILYHLGVPGASAGLGVLVFFVISGFLITHLLLREQERTGSVSLKSFYVRRSLRIFPAFYVYWTIAVIDMVLRHRIVWTGAICSFFYLGNYYQGLHGYPYSLLGHTWSLGVEEQFYLLWPGVFFLLRKSPGKMIRVLLVTIPVIWVYRDALYFAKVSDPYIYTALETRIDAILVGCLLAIVLHSGAAHRLIEEVRRPRYIGPIVALLAISNALSLHYGVEYRDLIAFAIDPIVVAILIAQLIAFRGAAWLDSAPVSYIGRISYSTYLYQEIVLPALKSRLPAHFVVIGCVVAVWIVAAISYEAIEKPFLKLKDRLAVVPVAKKASVPAAELESPVEHV